MEINVTAENFEQEVINSDIPVLVDFWAPWCGPCKTIAPHIEQIAKDYSDKLKVCKLNVDEANTIATKYAVMSIPTFIIFKEGKIMEKRVGVMSKENLLKIARPYM